MPVMFQQQKQYIGQLKFVGVDGKSRTITTDQYFIYKLFKKIKEGFSPTIAICGSQRIGKSFVGNWLCYTMMCVMGKIYDPTKSTFYEPVKAIEDLGEKEKEPLLIDEAGDVLDAREWYEQTHQALKSIINTQAYKTMMYIFISPFVIDIDKTFRKHFDFLIRCDNKGRYKTFIFVKKYDELNPNKVVYKSFLDDVAIKINSLPHDIWQRYLAYSVSEKEKIRKARAKKARGKDKSKPSFFESLRGNS